MNKASKNKQVIEVDVEDIDEASLAWKIFNAFVTEDQISVTEEELLSFAKNDLKIAESKLSPHFMRHITEILIAYMNMWAGWHFKSEFLAGKFQKELYFQRFLKYLIHKINTVARGHFNTAVRMLGGTTEGNVALLRYKTDFKNEQEFSSYLIHIECPPNMLNTIVFSNSGDDVIMKQHLGRTWSDLSTTQLINWPYVEVSFRTNDICFVRRQATEFIRYLNFLPHESNKYQRYHIEYAAALLSYGRVRECYSYDFLERYMRVYLTILKTHPEITSTKFEEIQTILSQFLEDVKYIDVKKSMATNTVVLFRLSPVPFIRNKKLVKNSDKEGEPLRVGYCEIVTPKIELIMLYFNAKQKDTPHLSFEYTDQIKNQVGNTPILPFISYKCTFCKVEYNDAESKNQMLLHLKNEHKMEQHVRCTQCKKQFDVLNLTACRWRHKCVVGVNKPVSK